MALSQYTQVARIQKEIKRIHIRTIISYHSPQNRFLDESASLVYFYYLLCETTVWTSRWMIGSSPPSVESIDLFIVPFCYSVV